MISIPYSRSNERFTFNDALILDDDVYAAMTPEEITAMQDARFSAWLIQVERASELAVEDVANG